jgi:hypothetical protein
MSPSLKELTYIAKYVWTKCLYPIGTVHQFQSFLPLYLYKIYKDNCVYSNYYFSKSHAKTMTAEVATTLGIFRDYSSYTRFYITISEILLYWALDINLARFPRLSSSYLFRCPIEALRALLGEVHLLVATSSPILACQYFSSSRRSCCISVWFHIDLLERPGAFSVRSRLVSAKHCH